MRFNQFKLLSERQLDELRMSPGSLSAFINSPAAEGMRAGFEAELIFTGLASAGGGDSGPDYDVDERVRSRNNIINFFTNSNMGFDTDPDRLDELIDERFFEWADERMFDDFYAVAEDQIRQYILDNDEWDEDDALRRELDQEGYSEEDIDRIMELHSMRQSDRREIANTGTDQQKSDYAAYQEAAEAAGDDLDEMVQRSIRDQDQYWAGAYDYFSDGYYDDLDFGDFLSSMGWRYMSDVENDLRLDWPYWHEGSSGGEFDYDNARDLASGLTRELGVKTTVSSGYHSTKRDDVTWIFEPDSSLEPSDYDDMPVEIVSPPMPIKETLAKMQQFFEWAAANGAYANNTTGFHMGVSLPDMGGDVDFVKLALFLGDEYVLREFGRSSNTFARAAMGKIRQTIGKIEDKEQISNAMELMRNGLVDLATKALEIGSGFGKYTSINPNEKYIEFRSAGGRDYFDDISKIQNTLMRYAQAMYIAGHPELERNEYYKKLYKLISPTTSSVELDLFARYASGNITREELKKQWAEAVLKKDVPTTDQSRRAELAKRIKEPPAAPVNRANYEVYKHDRPDQVVHTMPNATEQEVRNYIKQQEAGGVPPGTLWVRQTEQVTESAGSDDFVELARKFLPFVKQQLDIDELPRIKLLSKPLEGTFGKYHDGNIRVVVKGRHPVDVLRTLAHELVHWKQELNNELGPNAGDTGSSQENEANARAGIIMREFDHAYPELLKNLKNGR